MHNNFNFPDGAHILGQLYLGVDGGGTKCRMRLCNENLDVLAEDMIHSPANLQIRHGEAAYSAILELIDKVYAKAGLDKSECANTHAYFGMAGARMKSARDKFAARHFPFASVHIVDDIDIARAGAHAGEDGAVLIIGTGSAGLALVDGERLQIGGWGFFVGDSMAGATLGRELLRISLLAHEGVEQATPLTKAVMAKFDNRGDRLMSWSFDNEKALAELKEQQNTEGPSGPAHISNFISINARPSDYGSFVPMIFDFYELGDAVAERLMAYELAAIDQFVSWFLAHGAKKIAVVGGLGQRLSPMLEKIYPGAWVSPKADPLQGAIILAAQSAKKNST